MLENGVSIKIVGGPLHGKTVPFEGNIYLKCLKLQKPKPIFSPDYDGYDSNPSLIRSQEFIYKLSRIRSFVGEIIYFYVPENAKNILSYKTISKYTNEN